MLCAEQARLVHYKRYAEHLASWGYGVVQYETGLLSLLNDQVEVGLLASCSRCLHCNRVVHPQPFVHFFSDFRDLGAH